LDSLITAAAQALAAGDLLGVLKRVGLRDDPLALALRGIAMAQLGDLVRAKALLQSAARAFGPREAVARARCVVAEAEIALVSRDLGWPPKSLDAARVTLEQHGDWVNAAHARHLEIRRLLLMGGPNARSPDWIRRRSRPRRELRTNWSLRPSQCDAFGPRWRALRSLGPSVPRTRPVSLH
jgi:hypothetical protein